MPKVLIITASVREGRIGEGIGQWVSQVAQHHANGLEFESVDLKDFNFPNYDDAGTAKGKQLGEYRSDLVNAWAAKVDQADGFIIVTPEYNHGYPGSLKNALDELYDPWNNKPVAFVSYGASAGGARAVEQLRQVSAELQMADIREAVHIVEFYLNKLDDQGFPKDPAYTKALERLIDQLSWWVTALKTARSESGK